MKNKTLLLLLLSIPPLLSSVGCMSVANIAEQLKNDPATVDVAVQTIYGSISFHRAFPSNTTWVAPQQPLQITPAIRALLPNPVPVVAPATQ